MTEDARQEQEAIKNAVHEHVQNMREEDIEKIEEGKKAKLLQVKKLSAEELGSLLMDAAGGMFQRPSLIQILDEQANLVMEKLGLPDHKTVLLETLDGRATNYYILLPGFQIHIQLQEDDHYLAEGFLSRVDGEVLWSVYRRDPYPVVQEYVKECLVAAGVEVEDDEPEP